MRWTWILGRSWSAAAGRRFGFLEADPIQSGVQPPHSKICQATLSACLALAFCLEGCESASQERLRDYNQDGIYLFQRGDYAAARESFQAALTLKPEDPGLLYNIGECYDRLGDTAKAERSYRQC